MVGLNDDIASRWGPRIVVLLRTSPTPWPSTAPVREHHTARQRCAGARRPRPTLPCRSSRPDAPSCWPRCRPGDRCWWPRWALIGAVAAGGLGGSRRHPVPDAPAVIASHLPIMATTPRSAPSTADVLWQIRLPRVVLGGLVGAMLAGGGAAYQGVFRNPLADPYLLGVAAGAGLGRHHHHRGAERSCPPAPAGRGVRRRRRRGDAHLPRRCHRGPPGSTASIVLAGVAVAALLTAIQTYLQQQHAQDLRASTAGSWAPHAWPRGPTSSLILPYVAVSAVVLFAHRRLLDVLRVGEDEADSLGVRAARVRLIVVAAATLGTAAAVAVSGLIGFVGHHRAAHRAPHHQCQLPRGDAGLDGGRRRLLDPGRRRGPHGPVTGGDPHRRRHRLRGRPVLPLRPAISPDRPERGA